MMKKLKKAALLLVTVGLMTGGAIPTHAAAKKGSAIKAYKSFLEKETAVIDGKTCRISDCEFAFFYLNNDNIPELFVSAKYPAPNQDIDLYQLTWYTYSGGKMKTLLTQNFGVTGGNAKNFKYFKKKNVFVCVAGSGDNPVTTYNSIKKNTLARIYYEDTWWDDNNEKHTTFYKGTKVTTESALIKWLKSKVGNRYNNPAPITLVTNSAENRASVLK